MARHAYRIISADSHTLEPPDLREPHARRAADQGDRFGDAARFWRL